MRAAVLQEYGEPLAIESVAPPDVENHGVVVSVKACGICRSDWHAWQGHGEWADDKVPRGQILGHEPVGRIVETGDHVTAFEGSERVAIPFNLGCGVCDECVTGHGNICPDDRALGFESDAPGAFAERVHVPNAAYNLTKLGESVAPVDAAALGCRYVTAFNALVRRADIAAGEWVAVFGCGGVGLSAVQIASALGARVVAVDVDDATLDLASKVGATETVNGAETDDVPGAIAALTDGGAHVTMDALGRQETCHDAVESLRRRGRHVQVGLTTDAERGEIALPTDAIARGEIDFLGVRGLSPTGYDEVLRLVESGVLDPGRLVTREVGLDDVSERLAAMSEYETNGIEVVTEL
ncbi:zinc-dependent alcohol dehydrogenase family protein [Halococcus saccharolyticus]|uniref:Alcohol dehydrogenase GroES domain protein n=1 Tax=Halococcus saccharolyticus DSM 5350 TaxID=1227455 RepID=M0MLF4_9EURY|nr:zinc-dependent alcohol dehydrogenase family protein [Halococcus saccharolyticus]EMA46507.1 alcohol dehydrogenase GroES domain protein [Halococcus saccharolyticus DSM 5350]